MALFYQSTRGKETGVTASQAILKGLAEDGGLSTANSLVILGLDLLLIFFCKQVTTAIFLYFSYTR